MVSLLLVKYHKRLIAEINGDNLIFYSGIGLNDPSELSINRIQKTERIAKNRLSIHYDNKVMSVEADRKILDQLEIDLSKCQILY